MRTAKSTVRDPEMTNIKQFIREDQRSDICTNYKWYFNYIVIISYQKSLDNNKTAITICFFMKYIKLQIGVTCENDLFTL